MSKFIQIEEQIYKIPNKITIGRGEPFTVLNADQSVSRAHAIIVFKDGKWYLKNLKDSVTFINGHKTESNKFVEIHLQDKIIIGKSRVQLLESEPTSQYIVVKRTTNELSKNMQLLFLKWFMILLFIALTLKILFYKKLSIFVIITMGIVGIIYYLLYSVAKRITPKEITLAEDGFTVHFHNDSNMTFKRDDINYWTLWPWIKNVVVLTKKMNLFISIKDHKVVLEFLTKQVSDKKGKTPWWRIGLGLSLIPFMVYDYRSYTFFLFSLILIGVMGSIAVYCGIKYEKGWKQKVTIIPAGIYFILTSFICYNPEPVFIVNQLQMKCLDGDTQSCQSIDYYALDKDPNHYYTFSQEVLSKSCQYKNESACHFLKAEKNSRNIAGEKRAAKNL